jgi:hypothetical protein
MRSLIILPIFLASVLMSCDEPYLIQTKQAPPKVVIDGLITDKASYQSINVHWSTDFYTPGKSPAITDATVTVSDNDGNVFNFVHNPENSADSAGIYVPEIAFAGVVGKTYSLKVVVNGEVYEASDKLTDVVPIDSLSIKVDEQEQEDPEIEGRYYEMLVYTKEPQNEKNYYLFKFFRNDSLIYQNDTDIYYSDDELLAENIEGVEGPLYYSKGDKGKVEAYSMTRQGYVYYNDLSNLLNGDSGGMFGPIPASPRTNLSNGALGFFQVGAVKQGEILIE